MLPEMKLGGLKLVGVTYSVNKVVT